MKLKKLERRKYIATVAERVFYTFVTGKDIFNRKK